MPTSILFGDPPDPSFVLGSDGSFSGHVRRVPVNHFFTYQAYDGDLSGLMWQLLRSP